MKIKKIAKITGGQDGAIYNNFLFRFAENGEAFVYDLKELHGNCTEGSKKLMEYFDKLEKDITLMDEIGIEGQCYNPEICFGIKYKADENGRAYTIQYEKDGSCYVSHPVNILSNGVRWISRTPTEDVLGMVLPATAEHIGYENAKNTGQLKICLQMNLLNFI